jgi:hypothetical protein
MIIRNSVLAVNFLPDHEIIPTNDHGLTGLCTAEFCTFGRVQLQQHGTIWKQHHVMDGFVIE